MIRKKETKANSHFEFLLNRRLLNSKRSQSHVEIMLSFVIFIGVLIFIFIFLNPFAKTAEKVSVIDDIQKIVVKDINSEIGKLSVIGDSGIVDYVFPSEYGNNFVEVQETFLNPIKCQLYFSDIFGLGSKNCQFTSYALGVYSKEEMIVWDKIILLKQSYETDYNSLKSLLKISDDFSFSFKNIGGGEIGALSVSKNPPVGVNVESKDFPVRVIDSLGKINELILNIRVW